MTVTSIFSNIHHFFLFLSINRNNKKPSTFVLFIRVSCFSIVQSPLNKLAITIPLYLCRSFLPNNEILLTLLILVFYRIIISVSLGKIQTWLALNLWYHLTLFPPLHRQHPPILAAILSRIGNSSSELSGSTQNFSYTPRTSASPSTWLLALERFTFMTEHFLSDDEGLIAN